MNILYCGDENVSRGIYLSVLSLLKNTESTLKIYVFTAGTGAYKCISPSFAEKLRCAVKSHNSRNEVILFDITDIFSEYTPVANMGTRFTPMCMLRLFADLVDGIPDKILYLDADVMCRKDFLDFYNTDMGDAELMGVPDRYGKWFFGNVLKHDYLNSGVLLLNMKRIRESGLFEKCREMCRDKKMFMPDQSALNKNAVKKKAPARYNEQGKIKEQTVFKHFTTYFKFFPYIRHNTVKPWEQDRMHRELKIYEFDGILEEYKRRNANE